MNRSLLHVLILPVLFYSSSVGEIKNPDPERFSASFNKFSEQDLKNKRQGSGLTLFTGSSSIRRWDTLQMDFPHLHLLNRGFGGAHISDVLYFYDDLFLRYKPTRVVFYCGENDLWSGKPVSQVMNDFLALWAKIEKDLPECSLIYLSCKPSPKRISKWNTYQALNLRIKNLCLRKGRLTYVDLSPTLLKPNFTFNPKQWDPDQLHVNQTGYQRWTTWLRPMLAKGHE
jgi:lysophospholipase L1-like esterase